MNDEQMKRLDWLAQLELFEKARALIADEAHWCQRSYAEDSGGLDAEPDAPSACAWCAAGAIIRASKSYESKRVLGAYESLAAQLPPNGAGTPFMRLVNFNDNHSHPEVVALFDRTIARLQKEGP